MLGPTLGAWDADGFSEGTIEGTPLEVGVLLGPALGLIETEGISLGEPDGT